MNLVCIKNILCRFAYSQELSFQFFSGNNALFELKNMAKITHATETDCQRNSSETALQSFMKLCSYKETYCVHIFLGVMLFFILEIKF